MIILNVLDILMWFSFSFVVSFYASYFFVLYRYFKKNAREHANPSSFFYPRVSMVVPVYNEEKVIRKKIQNILELDYPKSELEVIFVDGCSTDNTSRVIFEYSKKGHSFIKLIKQNRRKGYNAAVFDGFSKSSGDIIAITQADALYDPKALKRLVRHFVDPEIGAVTGKQVIMNRSEALAPQLAVVYRDFYDFVRMAETMMDSPFDIKGEICAIRREICEHLLANTDLMTKACVDCCLSCQARLEGYRTEFEPEAKYYEYTPNSLRDRMREQVRRGTILIESLLLFKKMLLNKQYGLFGLVILPAHLFMLVVLPWIFLLGSICLPISIILDPIKVLCLLMILVLGLVLSPKFRTLLPSFILSQVALVLATLRVIAHRESQIIKQIPSTRR